MHLETHGWGVPVMGCQLRSGSQSPRPPAACTRSANCGPGAGPGLEAKAKWSEHLDQHIWMQVGSLGFLFLKRSSTLLWFGGLQTICSQSRWGWGEQAYKHQKNVTGTVARHERKRSIQNKTYTSGHNGVANGVHGQQLRARSFPGTSSHAPYA